MAKRKGASTSGPKTTSKAAKKGREAEPSETGVEEDDTFRQLTREFRLLDGKRAKLSEKQHELEEMVKDKERYVKHQQRNVEEEQRRLAVLRRELEYLVEQRQPLRREMEQLEQNWLPKEHRLKDMCSAREVENAKRLLEKLPPEVWEKILDELEEDDLFPLALSCRYFRQKQKELVTRVRQQGPESGKPRLALKTNLLRRYEKSQRPSAGYLRFCSNEKIMIDFGLKKSGQERAQMMAEKKDHHIKCLAAFHGHLPLLQQLLKPLNNLKKLTKANNSSEAQAKWNEISEIFRHAGESSSSSSSSVLF